MFERTAITPGVCMHCGMTHTNVGQCPRVSAVEYFQNGMIKRVEYHPQQFHVGPTKQGSAWSQRNGLAPDLSEIRRGDRDG